MKEGGQNADHNQGRAEPSHEGQDKASKAPGGEGAASVPGDTCMSQGQGKTRQGT